MSATQEKTERSERRDTLIADGTQTTTSGDTDVTFTETSAHGVEVTVTVENEPEAVDTTTCPECGEDVPSDASTCPNCGATMPQGEEDDSESEMAQPLPTWEGEIAFEGMPTSDGRYLIPGEILERELPLTLMAMFETDEGHMGAHVCGKITEVWREPREDLGEGVVAILGRGEFSEKVAGPTAAFLVQEQTLRGVSVDMSPTRKVLIDSETRKEVTQEEADYDTYIEGGYWVGMGGELMGATLVPFPAFAGASMRISDAPQATTASADDQEQPVVTVETFGSMRLVPIAITASAAGIAPLAPPKDWFFMEEPNGKTPLTVTEDGQVYGHLATWDQCHHGFASECVLAKRSRTNYAMFHVGQIRTAEGEAVDVGRIVVGESGHAGVSQSLRDATQFYDRTGMVSAFVRAVDGKYGIWLSGAVRSDCPAERVRDMMANPPSGDWRNHNGWLELIAALSVPVPGFPVPRYEYAMVASAEDVEIASLVATGYFETDTPTLSRSEIRRREMLLQQAKQVLA